MDSTLALVTTQDGFLIDQHSWNQEVATQIAELYNIHLTESHWEIIWFIRTYYGQYKHLPNTRAFVKAIANSLGPEKGNSRHLHQLFPDGPLKYACKIAGLPKPPNCL